MRIFGFGSKLKWKIDFELNEVEPEMKEYFNFSAICNVFAT